MTHRDLKPSNVLRHDGRWKVADFGIAKFVEDSTSLETLRESLTPPYGAPEQWRGERPSTATDVYAVGCIIHAIATGAPPFSGDVAALREKHLHENPKTLSELPSREAAFVAYMLRKAPDARPTLARCIQIFSEAASRVQQPSPAMSALADAAAKIAERHAQAEAATQAETSRVERRQELNNEANNVLQELRTSLFTRIEGQAVGAKLTKKDVISLGNAYLAFDLSGNRFERSETQPWDIVTWGQVAVGKTQRWGASLIFARKKPEDDYRWYEVAFFAQPSRPLPLRPGGAPPPSPGVVGLDIKDVRTVLVRNEKGEVSSVVAGRANLTLKVQLAYGPLPIDAEDEESFFDRWCVLLAKASLNELKQPSVFPINVPLFLGLETR